MHSILCRKRTPPWCRTQKSSYQHKYCMRTSRTKVATPRAMGSSNTSQTREPHFEEEPNLTKAHFTSADWGTSLSRQAWAANISACKDRRWWHPTAMITAGALVSELTGAADPLPILSHHLVCGPQYTWMARLADDHHHQPRTPYVP